jgi:hypothetical protein
MACSGITLPFFFFYLYNLDDGQSPKEQFDVLLIFSLALCLEIFSICVLSIVQTRKKETMPRWKRFTGFVIILYEKRCDGRSPKLERGKK